MQPATQNPTLQSLEILVGEWSVEISNMSFLPDPTALGQGRCRFEWLERGAYLLMHSGADNPDVPNAVGVIGRDDSLPTYSMLYFDSRGVSRIYEMSLEGRAWKQWRNAPGFLQRFSGTISDDGTTITASWEKLTDGSNWEHDFDMTYRRIDR